MKIGVIISTYNNPKWLEKVLWGYICQERKADEIVIADDGSTDETRQLLERYKSELPIKHIWHEDRGFQKSEILNKAIIASESEYLIFTDQDCIPREDFISIHEKYAEKGFFLSGGYYKLPMEISNAITRNDVESRDCFRHSWLRSKGLPLKWKSTKLCRWHWWQALMDAITTTKPTWNGMNSSGFREDIVRCNGFNMDMHYGGQDREFGERMWNSGLKSKQIRYKAICLHLDHKRPYKTKDSIEKNLAIRRNTIKSGIVETPNGIRQIK
jgi:glycosyltransferase involved in cell wall biosynthesis